MGGRARCWRRACAARHRTAPGGDRHAVGGAGPRTWASALPDSMPPRSKSAPSLSSNLASPLPPVRRTPSSVPVLQSAPGPPADTAPMPVTPSREAGQVVTCPQGARLCNAHDWVGRCRTGGKPVCFSVRPLRKTAAILVEGRDCPGSGNGLSRPEARRGLCFTDPQKDATHAQGFGTGHKAGSLRQFETLLDDLADCALRTRLTWPRLGARETRREVGHRPGVPGSLGMVRDPFSPAARGSRAERGGARPGRGALRIARVTGARRR